jgi:hypothetical protein
MPTFGPPVLSVEADGFRPEHGRDDLERFVQRLLPLLDRREDDTKLPELRFVPADSEPENESAIADVIEIAGQPRDHGWVAVVDAIHD